MIDVEQIIRAVRFYPTDDGRLFGMFFLETLGFFYVLRTPGDVPRFEIIGHNGGWHFHVPGARFGETMRQFWNTLRKPYPVDGNTGRHGVL